MGAGGSVFADVVEGGVIGAAERLGDSFNELSHAISKQELQPGDHIYVWRTKYGMPYQHHGIFIGEDQVVHFDKRPGGAGGFEGACVKQTSLDHFLKDSKLRRVRYGESHWKKVLKMSGVSHTFERDDPDLIVARALSFVGSGEGVYSLLNRNCEHLCIYCCTGRLHSEQVRSLGFLKDVAKFAVLVIGGMVLIGSFAGTLLGIIPASLLPGLSTVDVLGVLLAPPVGAAVRFLSGPEPDMFEGTFLPPPPSAEVLRRNAERRMLEETDASKKEKLRKLCEHTIPAACEDPNRV